MQEVPVGLDGTPSLYLYLSFGCQKTHDWVVDQQDDLFHTTHKVKTQQHVTKIRGRHCGNIDLTTYLVNTVDPVPLVVDLHIVHDRFGSNSDPSLTGSSEFVRLVFLQDHRETDRFFAVSGVQLEQHDGGLFHFRHTTFYVQLKSRVVETCRFVGGVRSSELKYKKISRDSCLL